MKNNILRAFDFFTAFVVVLCFIFSCAGMTAFEAYASTPSITLDKAIVGMGEEIVIRYNGTGSKDWIGIYADGVSPGPTPSLRWCYAEHGSGVVSLIAQSEIDANKPLPAGKYQIYLLQNDGYTILDRKDITVTNNYEPNDYMPSISFGSGRTVQITPARKYDSFVSYELYLGTNSGKLPGYTSLGNVTLKNNKYTYKLADCIVIPSAATHIYAYLKVGNEITQHYASSKLPNAFYNQASFGNKLYEFQVITDIHITDDNNGIHSQHFALALRDVLRNSPNSKAIITIGDNTDNGRQTQWKNFMKIKNSVLTEGKPQMYFTLGNHDLVYNGNYPSQLALFKKYTGMQGAYYSFKIENHTFIVLGSESQDDYADLSDAQLNWLKNQLANTSPEDPVFIFLHQPLKDTVSGSLSYLNPTIQDWYGVRQNDKLKKIVNPYPNVMFFTGHTHWHFNTTQPMLYGGGKTANYFNAASVAYLWDDEDQHVVGSEGYYIEVYENGIFARGRDFVNGLWTPATQYFVPVSAGSSTPTPVPPTTKPTGTSSVSPTLKPTQNASPVITGTPVLSATPTAGTGSAPTSSAVTPTAAASPSASASATSLVSKATPTSSPLPNGNQGGNAVLIIVAAVLSAAAIAMAVVAGILLYKFKKG